MRHFVLTVLLLIASITAALSAAVAKEPADKIRVLLTYGGHGFEEQPFFAMFDALPGIVYTKAPMPQAADLLKPSLKNDYDVVVMYDMTPGFTPEQQKNFVRLLKAGIGLVSLHHNIGSHQQWDEFREIIGGIHIPHVFVVDGKEYGPSGATDDQEIPVTVVDKHHPITKGVSDFTIHDETYHKYYTSPSVKVLLKTNHPKNEPPIAWVKQYGDSRVFYFMLGHDHNAWSNPNYARILTNGIHWVAEKSEKTRVQAILRGGESQAADADFAAAVRHIDQRGGQFVFDGSGDLVAVDLAADRVSVSDADLGCLSALPNLRRLKLSGSGITNAGARQIGSLAGLAELSLLDAQIDDAGMEQLVRLTNLASLSIRRSSALTDKGLEYLKRLPKLVDLGLLDLGITDGGLKQVAALARLRSLDLRSDSQLTNAGLQQLLALKSLRTLRLGGYQINDDTLSVVKQFTQLASLTLDEAAVTDAGLSQIAGLPLREIVLSRCFSITDGVFQRLAGFRGLRQLALQGIPLAGDGIKRLANKNKLVSLRLNETGIEDAALEPLRGLKSLVRLELRQTQVTDAAVDVLATLTGLKTLDISRTGITDVGAERLAKALPQCKITR
jgi:type 1 glutamine amidotransferase/Leucine-rich repeat (LRR) protein